MNIPKWKGNKYLYTSSFANVVIQTYEVKKHDHNYIVLEKPYNASAVLPVIFNDDMTKIEGIHLVKQFRPAVGKYLIEVPAGLLNEGENPSQAAVRELKEETGIIIREDSLIKVGEGYSSPGYTDESLFLFIAPISISNYEKRSALSLDEDEEVEALYIPINQLSEYEKQITDMKSNFLIMAFKMKYKGDYFN